MLSPSIKPKPRDPLTGPPSVYVLCGIPRCTAYWGNLCLFCRGVPFAVARCPGGGAVNNCPPWYSYGSQ